MWLLKHTTSILICGKRGNFSCFYTEICCKNSEFQGKITNTAGYTNYLAGPTTGITYSVGLSIYFKNRE